MIDGGEQPLGLFDRIVAPALGYFAALVLFGLMALTCADVVGRYFLGMPISGAFEMTEMLLASLIFAGLPLVTLRNDHITVDLLDPVVPDWLFPHPARRRLPDRLCRNVLPCMAAVAARHRDGPRRRDHGATEVQAGLSDLRDEHSDGAHGAGNAGAPVPAPHSPCHRAGLDHARRADRVRCLPGARLSARPDGVRHGHRRVLRRRLQAQLQRRLGDDRAGDLRDRARLHAVRHPAVHPDGQFRRPRAHVGGALSGGLLLPRASARRARHVDGGRVRRLRCHLWLLDRHRGDLHQGGLSVDAQVSLQGHARRRFDCRRRHARHSHSAVGRHGDLRHHDRDQHRQAVRRRRHPRGRSHRLAVPRGDVDHLARSRCRPAGGAAFLAGAPRRRSRTSGRW